MGGGEETIYAGEPLEREEGLGGESDEEADAGGDLFAMLLAEDKEDKQNEASDKQDEASEKQIEASDKQIETAESSVWMSPWELSPKWGHFEVSVT